MADQTLRVSVPDISFSSGTIQINDKPIVNLEYPYTRSAEAVNTFVVLGMVEARYLKLEQSLKEVKSLLCEKKEIAETVGEVLGELRPPSTPAMTSPIVLPLSSSQGSNTTSNTPNCSLFCSICGKNPTLMKFNTDNIKICDLCFVSYVQVKNLLQHVPQCSECSEYLLDQTPSSLGFNLCKICDNKNYL
jgi:hypothetical protein